MKYLQLIGAALIRRKARTVATLLSIVSAFVLFGLLDTVRSAFEDAGQSVLGIDRLVTTSKVSPFVTPLPRSLYEKIKNIPGVINVTYGSSFAGAYQDPKNFISIEAHAENYFELYPEWQLSPTASQALRQTATGAVAEASLAQKFGWKVGDKIPLQTDVLQKDGSKVWTFDLVGIYRVLDPRRLDDERAVFFNWDVFDEARQSENGTVGWYILKVADPALVDSVSRAVDALSANSDHETKTQDENSFNTALVRQFGDIGFIVNSILGAVCFTLMLLTGNTMSQSVRERIPELAILKTVGFTARLVMALVVCESVLLLLAGSTIGLALAAGVVFAVRTLVSTPVPILPVGADIWMRGLSIAVIVGLAVGVPPALKGMRVRVIDALARR